MRNNCGVEHLVVRRLEDTDEDVGGSTSWWWFWRGSSSQLLLGIRFISSLVVVVVIVVVLGRDATFTVPSIVTSLDTETSGWKCDSSSDWFINLLLHTGGVAEQSSSTSSWLLLVASGG